MRYLRYAAIAIPLLLVAFWAWQSFGPGVPIRVSRETTYLTEPLLDDGLPDYAGALLDKLRKGVTPENNGAIPFLQAMWPAEHGPEEQVAICEELGMTMPERDGMQYPIGSDHYADLKVEWFPDGEAGESIEGTLDDFEELVNQPWKRENCPWLAEWIDEYKQEYALLHKAAKSPTFYCPSPTLLIDPKTNWISILLPATQASREVEKCLRMRSYLHLGEGNVRSAWMDCQAMFAFADVVDQGCLVEEINSIAIKESAEAVAQTLLAHKNLDRQTADTMYSYLAARPVRDNVAQSTDEFERIAILTCMLEESGWRTGLKWDEQAIGADSMGPTGLIRADWNVVLEMCNEWFDRAVEACDQPNYVLREQAIEEFSADLTAMGANAKQADAEILISRQARSRKFGEIFVLLMMPACHSIVAAEDRANTSQQLTKVAAALALYRLENGGYPESLDALIPGLLDETPKDLFHNKPLVYKRRGEGYLLYSLGPNGTDDGGSSDTLRRYLGYDVSGQSESRENAVRKLLGEPPIEDKGEELGIEDLQFPMNEFQIEQLNDRAGDWLVERIPFDADDHAISLPLPRADAGR